MSISRMLIVGFIALLMQSALAQLGVPGALLPQLMLLVVVGAAFSGSSVRGVVSAFILGLLLDFSSALLVGPWAGAFVTVYAGLALVSQRLFLESGIVSAVVAFIAALVASTFFALLSPQSDLASWHHIVQILAQASVTAVCAPWFIALVARVGLRRAVPALRGTTSISAA